MTVPETVCDYLICGFEVTEERGKHLQGYVEFNCPLALTTVKSRLDPIMKAKSKVHVETAYNDREANIKYCMKNDTGDPEEIERYGSKFFEVIHKAREQGKRNDWRRIVDFIKDGNDFAAVTDEFPEHAMRYHGGIDRIIRAYKRRDMKAEFDKQYSGAKLYKWQRDLIKKLEKPPNDRIVYWVYDTIGNKGKSWLGKWLMANMGAERFENASTKDIALAYEGSPIVVFDYSRSMEEKLNYAIIESIKNGTLFSGKYISETKLFASPHIVCFANWAPRKEALSMDRWRIINIDNADCTIEEEPRAQEEAPVIDAADDLRVDEIIAEALEEPSLARARDARIPEVDIAPLGYLVARGVLPVCGNTDGTAHQHTEYIDYDNVADLPQDGIDLRWIV